MKHDGAFTSTVNHSPVALICSFFVAHYVATSHDANDLNTVDIAGLPPGEHKIKIELVDADHHVFPGQSKTVTLTVPDHQGLKAHSKALQ